MPIEVKGKILVKNKVVVKEPQPQPVKKKQEQPAQDYLSFRKQQAQKLYKVRKKARTQEDYDKIKLMVDGKEKKISQTSKYLLDMLIIDEE